jgi:hypothetical protein
LSSNAIIVPLSNTDDHMTKFKLICLICSFVAPIYSGQALCASISDVEPPLRKTAECMIRVLKGMPDLDQINLGVYEQQGRAHIYVEYRAKPDALGNRATVRFVAESAGDVEEKSYLFVAVFSGLIAQGTPGPNYGDLDAIEKRWKDQCGADTTTLLE